MSALCCEHFTTLLTLCVVHNDTTLTTLHENNEVNHSKS
ncbi:Uncharacterised protein [Vibrio cholerae]|nr:Uncharacterised protein [Vibrio cholerae]